MPTCQKATRPLVGSLRNAQFSRHSARSIRTFASTSRSSNDVAVKTTSSIPVFDPATVTSKRGENALMRSGVLPIGSRRRRAALKSSANIPFELLPYQCFQEARKVLQEDREEKLEAIRAQKLRISILMAQDPATISGGEARKQARLDGMRKHLEYQIIQADMNDPLVKKRFEDGKGDMNKPIYRYLADKKWREYARLIIEQRINQMSIVPDVLPHFEPTADVRVAFGTRNVPPGEFVDSRISEIPARLRVQVFDRGERLVSVVVIDSDVPIVEKDRFTSRCHFLATNIPLSPANESLPLSQMTEEQLVHKWLPPFAQQGSPYHRYSVFVLQQKPDQNLDPVELKEKVKRDGFSLRSFVSKYGVKPIGIGIFRSLWDEGTAGVMHRGGIEGADIVFKRKRIEALKPKQKARGWEARHSGGKFLSLGKYVAFR